MGVVGVIARRSGRWARFSIGYVRGGSCRETKGGWGEGRQRMGGKAGCPICLPSLLRPLLCLHLLPPCRLLRPSRRARVAPPAPAAVAPAQLLLLLRLW